MEMLCFSIFLFLLPLIPGCFSQCTGNINVTGNAGYFTSPNYPGSYTSSNCTWRVSTPPSTFIQFDFWNDFIGPASGTFVKIYDGADATASLLMIMSTGAWGDFRPSVITSSNIGFVHFFAPGNGTYGWAMYFKSLVAVPDFNFDPSMTQQTVDASWDQYVLNNRTSEGFLLLGSTSPASNTAIWNKTPLVLSDFSFVVHVTIGNTTTNSLFAYGLWFVRNATIQRPMPTAAYGISLPSSPPAPMGFAMEPQTSAMFMRRLGSEMVCGNTTNYQCYRGGSVIQKEHSVIVSITKTSASATYRRTDSNCWSMGITPGRPLTSTFDMNSDQYFFGISTYSYHTYYNTLAIRKIQFYVPTLTCNNSCPQNSVCTDNNCTCMAGWTGANCSVAICAYPCLNGGTCVGPNECSCVYGTMGRICDTIICVSNSTLTNQTSGIINSQNFSPSGISEYFPNANCGWLIVVQPGYGIHLDLNVRILGTGDTVTIYDDPNNASSVVATKASGLNYMLESFVIFDNDVFIKFTAGGTATNRYGFRIFYQQILLDPSMSYTPNDGNVSIANWDIYSAVATPYQNDGSLRLVDDVADTNGAMWLKTPIYDTDYVISAGFSISTTAPAGLGICLFLATNSSIARNPVGNSANACGINAGSFSGLVFYGSLSSSNTRGLYHPSTSDITARLGPCVSGESTTSFQQSNWNGGCDTYSLRQASMEMILVMKAATVVRAIFCAKNLNPTCQRITMHNALSTSINTLASGPVFIGVGAYNGPSNYDRVDVTHIRVFKWASNCSNACSGQATCNTNTTCNCSPLVPMSGLSCTDPTCSPICQNGGSCVATNVCQCANGWTGSTCTVAVCSTNTTIASNIAPGNYTSDGFPSGGSYSGNTRCGWILQASAGQIIELNLNVLTIDNNSTGDYLEVYNGGNTSPGVRLLKTSASRFSLTIQSTSNEMFVWWYTNSDNIYGLGFWFTFKRINATMSYNGIVGIIQSPGFGTPTAQYWNSQDDAWLIGSSPGPNFWIEVNTGTMGGGGDSLALYNGDNSSSPLISSINEDAIRRIFTGNSSTIFARFVSDASVTGTGYQIKFGHQPPNSCAVSQNLTGVLSGTIKSSNFNTSGFYGMQDNCGWLLQGSTGKVYSLVLKVMLMGESGGDSLRIHDGPDELNLIIFQSSASYYRFEISTSTNMAFVRFISNADFSIGEGFEIDFTEINAPQGNIISGRLQSLNYSLNGYYFNKRNDDWLISVPLSFVQWLTLTTASWGNAADNISIFDGNSAGGIIIIYEHSKPNDNHHYETSSNSVFIQFKSDANISGTGFNIAFQQATQATCSNTTISGQDNGMLSSPNYGTGFYSRMLQCFWLIQVTTGHAIWLDFSSLSFDNSSDQATIYDGFDASARALTSINSPNMQKINLVSSSNTVFVRFSSDSNREVGKGFALKFKRVNKVPMYSFDTPEKISYWDVLKSNMQPALLSDNSIELVPWAPSQIGAIWAKNPFGVSEFIAKIEISISSNGTQGRGIAIAFVRNLTREISASLMNPLALNLNTVHGAIVFANPAENSIYSVVSLSSPSAKTYTNCSGSDKVSGQCYLQLGLRSSSSILISVTNNCLMSVAYCRVAEMCSPVFQEYNMTNDFGEFLTSSAFFGITAYNDATNYESIQLKSVGVFSPTSFCDPPCEANGICFDNSCLCSLGFSGPTCFTGTCTLPCLNGGNCTGIEACTCPGGFTGVQCEIPVCISNSTILLQNQTQVGNFTSNNFGLGAYPANIRCGWLLDNRVPGFSIDLTINVERLADNGDVIEVHDLNAQRVVFRSSGDHYVINLKSSQGLFVQFLTFEGNYSGSGFSASFKLSIEQSNSALNGYVMTKGYPAGSYYPNQSATWILATLNATANWLLELEIETLTNETSDFVELHETSLIERIQKSGSKHTYLTAADEAVLRFGSGPFSNGTGFRLNFTELDAAFGNMPCQTLQTLNVDPNTSEYTLNSQSFPYYPPSTNCTWILQAPIGYFLWLELEVTTLDSLMDNVFVYDSNSHLAAISDSKARATFMTTTQQARIRLFSDSGQKIGSGFKLVYRTCRIIPELSFEMPSQMSNWEAYSSTTVYQDPSILSILQGQASKIGSVWAKLGVNVTNFYVSISVNVNLTGLLNPACEFGIFLATNSSIEREMPLVNDFGLDLPTFKGLAVLVNPASSSVFGSMENGISAHFPDSSMLRKTCTFLGNLPVQCGIFTSIHKNLEIQLSVSEPNILTFAMTSGLTTDIVYWKEPLGSSLILDELLHLGIAAQNQLSGGDHIQIHSVRFFTTTNCAQPCLNGGFCYGQNQCHCSPGWTDLDCRTAICSSTCQNAGTCILPNICNCTAGWRGFDCSEFFCQNPCQNNGFCITANICSCEVGWTGLSCEFSTQVSLENLALMDDVALAENIGVISGQVINTAATIANDGQPEEVMGMLDSLGDAIVRLSEVKNVSTELLANFTKVSFSAADVMLTSVMSGVKNLTTVQPKDDDVIQLPDDVMKCKLDNDGQPTTVKAETLPKSAETKDQLQRLYNLLTSTLATIFNVLSMTLTPGKNITFSGEFYDATIYMVRVRDIPGLKLAATLAEVQFPVLGDSTRLFSSVPSDCPPLTRDSIVPIVMTAFVTNVVDVNKPLNMPTITINVYCNGKSKFELNKEHSIRITGKPPVTKAQVYASNKIDMQCEVSKVKCDPEENAADLGSLAVFPLTQSAGDFVIIFPNINFNFTALINFDTPPSAKKFNWSLNVSGSEIVFSRNESIVQPRYHFTGTNGGELRVIITREAIEQYRKSLRLTTIVKINVFMKRSNSKNVDYSNSVCTLQRIFGYHLSVGLAKGDSKVKREAESNNNDGFQLEPESTESSVAFKSSYFGDFGADLVISPNTIEFSEIFANFATLVSDNAGVLAFQCATIGLFLVAVIIAFKFDKADLNEWAFLPLISNNKYQTNPHYISINILKGVKSKSKIDVHVRLHGVNYETTWRKLDDGVRSHNFKGGHPANFNLCTQIPLGRIDAIELMAEAGSHSETKQASLYIDRVTLLDAITGLKYVYLFKCKLFADGRPLKAELAREEDVKGYSYLINGHSRTSLTDNHPWISTISRPLPSNWTRVERVACLVSALFMAMMVNAMFYGKEAVAPRVGLSVGGLFKLSWFTVWTSFVGCLIVIPPTAIIAFIFKRTKRRSAEKSQICTVFNLKIPKAEMKEDDANANKAFQLPYLCCIIAWFLVAACIGTSAFMVVMYSLSWGKEKSLTWLSSMVLNITQDVILIQPVKVLLGSVVNATLHSLPDDGLSIGKITYNRCSNRQKVMLFYKLRGVLTGIFHHAIYVMTFAIVVATMTNSYAFIQVKTLKKVFAMQDGTESFRGTVNDYNKIYQWLDQTVLEGLLNSNQLERGGVYGTPWAIYEGTYNPHVSLLGPIRLRQRRVFPVACPVRSALFIAPKNNVAMLSSSDIKSPNRMTCQPSYSESRETNAFNESWSHLMEWKASEKNITQREYAWIFRQSDGFTYQGWEMSHPSGGYYLDLPRRLPNAKAFLKLLFANRWLDNATSVLFVDFNLFNVQTNLFIPVKVVFEALAAGGMSYHMRLFPLQLYMYSGASSILIFAIQGLWVLLLLSHLARAIRSMKKETVRAYTKNGWNILDLCQIILGLAIVIVFAVRIYFCITFLEKIQSMRSTFVELDLLVYWEDLLFCLFGIQFFMAMMCFFRHLSVNKHWAILLSTLSQGKLDLISYGCCFCFATIFFAGITHLVMGNELYNFSSFTRSMMVLIQSIIGTINVAKITAKLYLVVCMTYTATVVFLGTNMFVTLILSVYSEVTTNPDELTEWDSDLSNFVSDGIQSMLKRKEGNLPALKPKQLNVVGNGNLAKLEQIVHRMDNIVSEKLDIFECGRADRSKLLWAAKQLDAKQIAPESSKRRVSQRVGDSLPSIPDKMPTFAQAKLKVSRGKKDIRQGIRLGYYVSQRGHQSQHALYPMNSNAFH